MLPAAVVRLVVNYIVIYDFCGSAADVIHQSNPLHLIVCFELFCHTLTLCHLFYEPKKHILSLLIYIGKVSIQFAFCEQMRIKTFTVCLDILQQFRFFLLYLNIYGIFLFLYYPHSCFYLI